MILVRPDIHGHSRIYIVELMKDKGGYGKADMTPKTRSSQPIHNP
jgi:hypothetical protein